VDRADSTAPTSVPATRDSAQEMERALLTLFGREHRREVYQNLAEAADVQVSPRGTWLLYRIADHAPISEAALARLLHVERHNLAHRLTELTDAGYVTLGNGAGPAAGPSSAAGTTRPARTSPASGDGAAAGALVALTPAGQQAATRLEAAREDGITRLMTGWHPDMNPQLRHVIKRITTTLVATDGRGLDPAPTAPATPGG
jgi:DNA-binding MarR family transcriptional regulator